MLGMEARLKAEFAGHLRDHIVENKETLQAVENQLRTEANKSSSALMAEVSRVEEKIDRHATACVENNQVLHEQGEERYSRVVEQMNGVATQLGRVQEGTKSVIGEVRALDQRVTGLENWQTTIFVEGTTGRRQTAPLPNIDRMVPAFSGKTTHAHPVRYIKRMDRYLRNACIPEALKVELFLSRLVDAAEEWGQRMSEKWDKYSQCREAFVKRYWNSLEQDKLIQEIFQGRYYPESGVSMSDYLRELIEECEFLDTPFSQERLVHHIAKHLPRYVRDAVITANVVDCEGLIVMVERFEQQAVDRPRYLGRPLEKENTNAREKDKPWRVDTPGKNMTAPPLNTTMYNQQAKHETKRDFRPSAPPDSESRVHVVQVHATDSSPGNL